MPSSVLTRAASVSSRAPSRFAVVARVRAGPEPVGTGAEPRTDRLGEESSPFYDFRMHAPRVADDAWVDVLGYGRARSPPPRALALVPKADMPTNGAPARVRRSRDSSRADAA